MSQAVIDPTELASGDSAMAIRSVGMMPARGLPVVTTTGGGGSDVWALAARLAQAHDRVAMRATCAEIRALAQAVLELTGGLVACRATDRSAPYGDGEARPDGAVPEPGQRWRTPRLVVDQIIGWEDPT